MSYRFKFLVNDCTWVFRGVYGPTTYGIREHLRDELGAIRGLCSDLWCIGGDFNITRFPNERNREGRITGSMRRFSQVIDDLELKDFSVQGSQFTWKGGLHNCRMATLDKFLVSENGRKEGIGTLVSSTEWPIPTREEILSIGFG